MKPKKIIFVLVIALASIMLSGCAGQAGMTNSWPELATDGETAYLASGSFVYAIDLSNGKEVWRYPDKANSKIHFIAKPVIASDGTVIVGSAGSDHRLVALDPSNLSKADFNTPAEKWIFSDAGNIWVASPLIMGDIILAPNSDGMLYVLALQDGFSTKSALEKVDLSGALWAQPSTDGERIYISSLDHHLHAIDADTYDFAWPTIDLGGAAPGSPLVGPNGNIYIGSFASEVIKVDPASGKTALLTSTQGWVWSGPVTDGQNIYFGDLEGNLYAVDASTAKQVWTFQSNGPITGSPLVVDGNIVFATETGAVYAVDAEGTSIWQRELGGQIYTAPVVAGENIVVAPMKADFALALLDSNGNQVWTFSPEN